MSTCPTIDDKSWKLIWQWFGSQRKSEKFLLPIAGLTEGDAVLGNQDVLLNNKRKKNKKHQNWCNLWDEGWSPCLTFLFLLISNWEKRNWQKENLNMNTTPQSTPGILNLLPRSRLHVFSIYYPAVDSRYSQFTTRSRLQVFSIYYPAVDSRYSQFTTPQSTPGILNLLPRSRLQVFSIYYPAVDSRYSQFTTPQSTPGILNLLPRSRLQVFSIYYPQSTPGILNLLPRSRLQVFSIYYPAVDSRYSQFTTPQSTPGILNLLPRSRLQLFSISFERFVFISKTQSNIQGFLFLGQQSYQEILTHQRTRQRKKVKKNRTAVFLTGFLHTLQHGDLFAGKFPCCWKKMDKRHKHKQ